MRVMLTGGGTGGHIFPLLAVVEELRAISASCEFHWFGSRRMEAEIVPQAGIQGTFVSFTFSYRKLSLNALGYYLRTIPPWLLGSPVWAALKTLSRIQPDVVLSSGGYVSVPMLLAAKLSGIPIALLEINSVPGRATRGNARTAWRIYCATESIASQFGSYPANKVLVTGYPVLKPMLTPSEARAHFGLPANLPILVIQGGSSGASPVNKVIDEMLQDVALANKRSGYLAILHQRGNASGDGTPSHLPHWPHYRTISFDRHLTSLYYAASLYFGRSGAATVGELAAAKLPAALMPYTMHADKQQYSNANTLVSAGAAVLFDESDADIAGKLGAMIEECVFGARGEEMRAGYSGIPSDGALAIATDMAAQFFSEGNR